MSQEKLKAKMRWAMEEAYYKGNLDALDEAFATGYVLHHPPLPDEKGLAALKEKIAGVRQGYSDIDTAWHEWIAEGDVIVYRTTLSLTHTGVSPSMPIPPTGKRCTLESCTVAHTVNGKVVEEFEYSDYLGFLQQLGVVPPLG
jgi:predicted ester cyclase